MTEIANGDSGLIARQKINAAITAVDALVDRTFPTVAALLADAALSYSGAGAVVAGDIVEAEGYRYAVAASTAADHHVATAGGVKLTVRGMDGRVSLAAFGPDLSNATAAVTTALAASDYVYIPAGTYTLDRISITARKHIELHPQAVLKLRTALAHGEGFIDFATTATGSSFIGGTLDLDRATHGASHTSGAVTAGLKALNVDDFTFGGTTIQNAIHFAAWIQGNRVQQTAPMKVRDCGALFQLKKLYASRLGDWTAEDIGNGGLATYQHAGEFRDSDDVTLGSVILKDYAPDIAGLEPTPTALVMERSKRIRIGGLTFSGQTGASSSGNVRAFAADTVDDMTVGALNISGYQSGALLAACRNVSLPSGQVIGEGTGIGVRVEASGILTSETGAIATNARTPVASHNIRMGQGFRVAGFNQNMLVEGSRVYFDGECVGSGVDGIEVSRPPTTGLYTGGTPPRPSGVVIGPNARVTHNSGAGVYALEAESVRVLPGADLRNNGQNTALGNNRRSGVCVDDTTTHVTVGPAALLGDSQTFTITAGCSFTPGATDASNRFAVYLNDLSRIEVGQWLTLTSVLAGPANATGRVYAVDMATGLVTLQFSGALTFVDTHVLTALTGTVSSSSGGVITGTGTAFTTEVPPLAVVKSGSAYSWVRRVNSATQLVTNDEWSPALVGATMSVIKANVSGIPSQQYGERRPAAHTGRWRTMMNDYQGAVLGSRSLGTALASYADDVAAAAGGVAIGEVYRRTTGELAERLT